MPRISRIFACGSCPGVITPRHFPGLNSEILSHWGWCWEHTVSKGVVRDCDLSQSADNEKNRQICCNWEYWGLGCLVHRELENIPGLNSNESYLVECKPRHRCYRIQHRYDKSISQSTEGQKLSLSWRAKSPIICYCTNYLEVIKITYRCWLVAPVDGFYPIEKFHSYSIQWTPV
jgi:hypothetical protein